MFKSRNSKGESREVIRLQYAYMLEQYANEEATKRIEVGDCRLPVKPTTPYLIAVLMNFHIDKLNHSIKTAYESSLVNLAIIECEIEEEVIEPCAEVMRAAFEWHHDELATDAAKAVEKIKHCRLFAKQRLSFVQDFRAKPAGPVDATAAVFMGMVNRLQLETPYKAIKVGDEFVPLKKTDSYFLAINAAYQIAEQRKAKSDAIEFAIVVMAIQVNGKTDHKIAANGVLKSAVTWHEAQLKIDHLRAESNIARLREIVDTILRTADGIDLRQIS